MNQVLINSAETYFAPILPTTEQMGAIADRLDAIEKRLLILQPNLELQDKYVSLKEAYDNYKLIERLLTENGKT